MAMAAAFPTLGGCQPVAAALTGLPAPMLSLRGFRPSSGRPSVKACYSRPPPLPRQPRKAPEPQELDTAEEMEMWMERVGRLPLSARGVAVEQLMRVEMEGAFVGLVGGSPVPGADTDGVDEVEADKRNKQELSDRDARFVTELVAGVTRWRRRLDYVIAAMAPERAATLSAPLRQVLRLGLYELLELGTPSHVVNEHVEIVRRLMHPGAAGFANAVLRNVARQLEGGALPKPAAAPRGAPVEVQAEALGVASSHPTWLVQRWLGQYGEEATIALLKANNMRPIHSLRLRPGLDPAALSSDLAAKGLEAVPSRYLPSEFIKVKVGLQALLGAGVLARGEAQVQDEAAGLVVAALDPQPGEVLLDACAAPGGKTLFSAARMGGKGRIVALDVSGRRLAALGRAAERQGVGEMVAMVTSDLRQYLPPPADGAEEAEGEGGEGAGPRRQYDRVLLDAPCSGTGVLAKRADLRWRREPQVIASLAALQDELLDAAAPLVRPGGLLVYSTCSLEGEENEERVAAFLSRHPEYSPEAVPEGAVPSACVSAAGHLVMLPHVHGTDGAFAARLRRAG